MSKLIIDGPAKLRGTVTIGGSKNAVLPILAASLLATAPVTLTNVPAIRDVEVMLRILEHFGVRVTGRSGTVRLDPRAIRPARVPDALARSLRASVLLLAPALVRFGEYTSVHPGGDVIGKRSLDTHFRALAEFGAKTTVDHARYHVVAKRLRPATVFLEEPSVTTTENIIMAAVRTPGRTVIKNAASELHVRDLAHFLNGLGAQVQGAGTNKVVIDGVERLGGGRHRVRADEIEAGTFAIAAAATGGTVTLAGIDPEHFGVIWPKLRDAGVKLKVGKDSVTVSRAGRLRATDLKTHTWPGFPTDLSSPFTVLMTQARGKSLIHDHMYEGRFFYTDKLVSMGADIVMADPHRVIVSGPTPLAGHELESPDIRAGMTLLVAALIADGRTIIDHAELIDRGYERIDARLRKLGAKIRRVEERRGT